MSGGHSPFVAIGALLLLLAAVIDFDAPRHRNTAPSHGGISSPAAPLPGAAGGRIAFGASGEPVTTPERTAAVTRTNPNREERRP